VLLSWLIGIAPAGDRLQEALNAFLTSLDNSVEQKELPEEWRVHLQLLYDQLDGEDVSDEAKIQIIKTLMASPDPLVRACTLLRNVQSSNEVN
jgi:hypothetical protein